MKALVKHHSETTLQITCLHTSNYSKSIPSKKKDSKGWNYRGRQLNPIRKALKILNEINNISTRSTTCETKNNIQRVNNSKPKKRYDKRKRQTISSSESDNSDNDSISSYEMRKRSFLDDDNSFVHHTRKDEISEEESSENESPPLKDSLETEIEKHLIDIYNKNISNCNYMTGAKYCNQCDIIRNYRRNKMRTLNYNENEVSIIYNFK